MNESVETLAVSPLMFSREVAAYLKVSESTLSRWRSAGTGPPFLRLGGIARYRLDAVDRWLAERQQLILNYRQLRERPEPSTQTDSELTAFCDILVDYVSAGHFEIYEQLINEAREYDDGGLDLANKLVPRLDKLTTQCVDFNDTYDKHCSLEQLGKLPTDLSAMGENLEERFQLEDQLIERLHNIHRELVTE